MRLTLCQNPFDLTRDRVEVPIAEGQTVGKAFRGYGVIGKRFELTCNGKVIEEKRVMRFKPKPGDELIAVPILGNPALKTIALVGATVAAAYFTAGLGSFIGGTLFPSLSTATQNAIAAGILTNGAALLVNGVASLFQKSPGGGGGYGVMGPMTNARSGIAIPKGYGKMRRSGNIVESWVDIQGSNGDAHDVDDGADTIGRQYVNCRIDFGFGPARTFENLQLNGRDIAEYQDVAYCLLYGENDQAPVTVDDSRWVILNQTLTGTTVNTQPTTGFDTINNNYPQNQRVRCGVANNYVIVKGKRKDTQRSTVFVTFNQGAWRTDNNGVLKRLAIDYDVYYRRSGSGDAGWVLAQHHYYYNIRQTLLRQATIIDFPDEDCWDIKVVKNGSGAVFNPLDYFEHESNKFGDELWVESVQETSFATLRYPGQIQVCLRFMATGQLSGTDVNLTADITHGLRNPLPAELADLPEDCPAAVAYDIAHDEVTGGNLPDDRIDLDDFFRRWADLTQTMVDDGDGGTQRLAVFNGVLDKDGQTVWDALTTVAVMSRANLQRVGTKLTGWLDAPDVPVQMFHAGNIIRDSYDMEYLNLEERAQEVEISFADAQDDYKTRNPLRVVTTPSLSAEQALKKSRVTLIGCTDQVQAYYWGQLRLNELEDLLRTHKWMSNIQAVRARVGNVVLLQRDVPRWGDGGNVLPGSTTSKVKLDKRGLPFLSGNSYTLWVLHPALQRATVNITSIFGSLVTVTGFDGSAQVLRLKQGSVDVAIRGILAGSSPLQITVDDSAGLALGPATVWDLDVLESRDVSSFKNGVATLSSPLSAVPQDYAGWIYQSTASQPKLVRIKNLRKIFGQQRYEITAVDYTDESYDLQAPTAIY